MQYMHAHTFMFQVSRQFVEYIYYSQVKARVTRLMKTRLLFSVQVTGAFGFFCRFSLCHFAFCAFGVSFI